MKTILPSSTCLRAALTTLLLLALLLPARADLKIAVIDLGQAFDQDNATKDARAKLNDKRQQFQKELRDLASDYNQLGEVLQGLDKAKDDPTLGPAAREEKAKLFEEKKRDFLALQSRLQERRTELDKELNDEVLRRHKEILDAMQQVIGRFAASAGYDVVLDTSTVEATSGASIVLYHSAKLADITADIVKLINASAPATASAAPPAVPAVAPSGIAVP
ncbi:MAG: OmpH family outer membrane protein [Verrucomicrobiota bacterium]